MKKLKREVDMLMMKGKIYKSMGPYDVLVLHVPKNDGTWRA